MFIVELKISFLLCFAGLGMSPQKLKDEFLGLFPREAGASEMAVAGGLLVDWALQVKVPV